MALFPISFLVWLWVTHLSYGIGEMQPQTPRAPPAVIARATPITNSYRVILADVTGQRRGGLSPHAV